MSPGASARGGGGGEGGDAKEKLLKVPNRPQILELAKDLKKRFILELEFVELLSNPFYLQYLAQNRYFSDPSFVNYLNYLQYWRRPEYIKHISYPHCLYFLELLQKEEFREKLLDSQYIELLHRQQYYHWRNHKHHRFMERIREEEKEHEDSQQAKETVGSGADGDVKQEEMPFLEKA